MENNKEAVKNTGLSRKTKEELINIILRKDAVEQDYITKTKELNNIINILKNENINLKNKYTYTRNLLIDVQKDIKKIKDELSILSTKYINKMKFIKNINISIIVIFVLYVVLLYFL